MSCTTVLGDFVTGWCCSGSLGTSEPFRFRLSDDDTWAVELGFSVVALGLSDMVASPLEDAEVAAKDMDFFTFASFDLRK